MRRYDRSVRLAIIVLGIIATGCASAASRRSAVPVRNQSSAQQTQDVAECERFAADNSKTDTEWDRGFAACLIARGYRVSVPVRIGVEHARVGVQAVAQPSAEQVLSDLRLCETRIAEASRASRASSRDVVVGGIGA